MLSVEQALAPLAARRADAVVVATMSAVRPWGALSRSALDIASADSAMGHAADLALGIALARPERPVWCINGDGSLLMSLGILATVAEAAPANFRMFVIDNRAYEITGSQPVPAARSLDFAALARAAGWPAAYSFDDAEAYARGVDDALGAAGPVLTALRVSPGTQGPLARNAGAEYAYLQVSLAESARLVRDALASGV